MSLMDKLTRTEKSAMTEEEIHQFLNRGKPEWDNPPHARVATIRPDGYPHVTPIWYLWEDERFLLNLGKERIHVKNLRENNKIGLIIDQDYRPTQGMEAGAIGVHVRGTATLKDDRDLLSHIIIGEFKKMMGEENLDDPEMLVEPILNVGEGRIACVIEPDFIMGWNFAKAPD